MLNSPYFQFNLNPKDSTWSLFGKQQDAPSIEGAWMRVDYRTPLKTILLTGGQNHSALVTWIKPRISAPQRVASPVHGAMQTLTLESGPDDNRLHFRVEFALPEAHPLFLWRLTVENRSKFPVTLGELTLMQAGFFPKRRLLPASGTISLRYQETPTTYGTIRPHPVPGELAFYSNAWQSWGFTGTLGHDETRPHTRLSFFTKSIWYNQSTPQRRRNGHFTADMFGVLGDRRHRSGILAGFLSQKQHFGSLEASTDPMYPALRLWANGEYARLDPGTSLTTDWAAIQFVAIDNPDPLAPYLEAVAREHPRPADPGVPTQTGWTTWYQYEQEITPEIIRANLNAAREMRDTLPLDLFQVDDGFQTKVGDWFELKPEFPDGLAPLAREIEAAGMTPGLWLAPFILWRSAKTKRRHKDWVLRNRAGVPVNAGFVWDTFATALDPTHPDALAYAQDVVRTAVREWGFKFLKLDFLYAAALPGRYRDRTKTRAQALRAALEALREAAGPEVHLMGCGVPFGSALGIFNSVRVGPDVAAEWTPSWQHLHRPFRGETSMPSARNAIQNALTRAPLHNRWWSNDPDCLLARPDGDLTPDEVRALATVIALTGGRLLLSDDLTRLPADRLRLAARLVPLLDRRPRLLDWFDTATPRLLRLDLHNATGNWHLLAIFNWEDDALEISLPLERFALSEGEYHTREFWGGATGRISGGTLSLGRIPAHGVKLFSLRPVSAGQPAYLGSDLHISQGLEVARFEVAESALEVELARPASARGRVDLYLPEAPKNVSLNGASREWESLPGGVYRFEVAFHKQGILKIGGCSRNR